MRIIHQGFDTLTLSIQANISDWKVTTFNARLEDAAVKPTFGAVWKHGRCLLPISGYFDWASVDGAKQPNYIQTSGNEGGLFCAGLASRRNDLLTVTMMIRPANSSVSDIHHRMPVVLNTDERDVWLSGDKEVSALSADAQLKFQRVRKFGRDDEGPTLVEPC